MTNINFMRHSSYFNPFFARCYKFFMLGFVLTISTTAKAQLPAELNALLSQYNIPESSVSAQILPLDKTSKALLSHRSQKPRNPASTMKLVTTFAALDILGPAYGWKTYYYLDGDLSKGVLNGDLIIKGSGDPYLVKEQFWLHLAALREKGLKKINGRLLIDNSAFSLRPYDSGKFDQQPTRLYNVGASATVVNFNASRFRLRPIDGKVEVILDPPMHNIKVDNQLTSAKGKCRGAQSGWTFNTNRKNGVMHVSFTGSYRKQCGSYDLRRAVLDSDEYLHGLFTNLWQSLGGEFNGSLGRTHVPESLDPFYIGGAKTLAEVISGANKYSNNLLAKQLLLSLGRHQQGDGATVADGIYAIKQWLRAQHLNMPGLVIDNGAGLSRHIRITAKSLAELLQASARNIYAPEFMASFSLSGVDGTMKKRLKKLNLGARARLKTGYVKGVRSLAGFIRADSGKDYAVVLFVQNKKVNFTNGNKIQDALIKWVLKQG